MDTTNTDSNTQESNSEQRNNNPSVDNSRPGIIITENTIDVGRIKQMIDLNGDSINFEVSFTIKSKDGKPFEMLVTDQNTLDTKADLEYQHVPSGGKCYAEQRAAADRAVPLRRLSRQV